MLATERTVLIEVYECYWSTLDHLEVVHVAHGPMLHLRAAAGRLSDGHLSSSTVIGMDTPTSCLAQNTRRNCLPSPHDSVHLNQFE